MVGWLISVVARAQKSDGGCGIVMSDESGQIFPRTLSRSRANENTRRAFLAAAGVAGLLYTAALAYPIYRYLASPEEMAMRRRRSPR